MEKLKSAIFSLDIYREVFMVSLESDEELMDKLHSLNIQLNPDEVDALILRPHQHAKTVVVNGNFTVLRFREDLDFTSVEGLRQLVHEVFHAITLMFYRKQITIEYNSDEAAAYAIDYLFGLILERFSPKKKVSRRK